jgi:CYTH domain-containing protein
MAWEMERRFLFRVADGLWYTLSDGHHYGQGYIWNGEPSVRIRTGEPRGARPHIQDRLGHPKREGGDDLCRLRWSSGFLRLRRT